MDWVRGRLTYANVMSTIAVVLVVAGGTAFAANELRKNSVKSRHIAPGAVKTKDLGNKAVTRSKIRPGAVNASRLAEGAVTNSKLAAGAVGASKLGEGAVAESKLSPALRSSVNGLQRGGIVRVNADIATQFQATEHTLLTRGPFRIYAKCWSQGQNVTGQAFVSSSQPGALAFGTLLAFRGGQGNDFLGPTSTEPNRRFATTSGVVSATTTSTISGGVSLVHGSTSIQVGVSGFVKGSGVEATSANYGAGPGRCLFSSYLIAASG